MVTFSDFFESDLHSKTGKFDFKEGDLTILTICPTVILLMEATMQRYRLGRFQFQLVEGRPAFRFFHKNRFSPTPSNLQGVTWQDGILFLPVMTEIPPYYSTGLGALHNLDE